ncbi:hypothetical protein HJG60_013576 [Phyllostomus discolor]|uniref:Uncharacterized protein n=1 Tax=Phyllostomus discolor TaxID=89673 RepID=A0A834BDK7_9CHIR|nr:hypothetical protein HJG60_013576 [Phyllostomus discolor]
MQSQFPWYLQLQTRHLTGLNVLCLLFLAPQLWSQLAYFCQPAWGSSWSRVTLSSVCWRPTSEASTI